MIVLDRLASVTSSSIDKECSFDLDEEGLAVVLDILRSQLYSRKELAVIREISCNAKDAMVEAAKGDRPILVTLPTDLEPTFKVRDFGKGLTYEEIKNVYVKYGASTKRNSNLYIGQKGIGAKSPFAYGDSFMVVSYQSGRKTSYTAYLDPSMVGKMAMLNEEEAAEEDGIEVIVSVREDDVNKFQIDATEFFKYWTLRPNFLGFVPTYPAENNVFVGKKSLWTIPAKNSDTERFEIPVAIMGDVAYPLNYDSIDWTGQDFSLRNLFNVGIRMWMDIGEIEVSASREALQFTTQTQTAIIRRLVAIREELAEEVNKEMTGAKTMYEAKNLFEKVFDLASPLYIFRELFGEKLTFNGKPVTNNYWDGDNELKMGAAVKHFCRADNGKKAYSNDNFRIYADSNKPIIFNDLKSEHGLVCRIAPLLELDQNHLGRKYNEVQLVSVKDEAKWQAWLADKSYDAPMVMLSDLPKVSLKTLYPPTTKAAKAAATKIFTWESSANNYRYGRRGSKAGRYWKDTTIDYNTQTGVYVEMKGFKFKKSGGAIDKPQWIRDIVTIAQSLGLHLGTIYGLRTASLQKSPPPNMVNLHTYMKQQIRAKLDEAKLEQEIVDRAAISQFNMMHNNVQHIIDRIPEFPATKSGTAANFHNEYDYMLHKQESKNADSLRSAASHYGITLKTDGLTPSFDLNNSYNAMMAELPLLTIVEDRCFSYKWDESKTGIIHYINLTQGNISKNKNPEFSCEDGAEI